MNIALRHTQSFGAEHAGKKEHSLRSFFGLSFLLHLCSALLFIFCADSIMNKCSHEVFYIDLNQSILPVSAPAEVKPKQAATKPRQAHVPVKAAQPAQPVKAPSQPIQQTVFSESAKPLPDTEPVSGPVREATAPQTGGSGKTAVSGVPTEGAAPTGDVTFGSASGPSFMQRVLPVYPMVARRFNREGKVILRLTIDAVGSLHSVEVLQDPGYGFALAAVDAVRKSRFNPARHAGRPFTAKAILPIRFTLQGVD